jgi:dGTPase
LIHSAAFRRLQGKTQLFPSHESDFFRNRLTHSLEVAQIAKSIAIRINSTVPYFRASPIDADLVETAALAHDLGHPPFGHNGEFALDRCMRNAGGFEGNAQTLRILAKLEKRDTRRFANLIHEPALDGRDNRAGLNLTYRTLAAVLKYDREIPRRSARRRNRGVVKGYYHTEASLVAAIKRHVGVPARGGFRTVECAIMDIADDIAYSTYDLEDSFKANFLTPLTMVAAPFEVAQNVARTVSKRLNIYYPDLPTRDRQFTAGDVYVTILGIFDSVFTPQPEIIQDLVDGRLDGPAAVAEIAAAVSEASSKAASIGYFRTRLTSDFVGTFIRGVNVTLNAAYPTHSKVRLDLDIFKQVEVLKNFAYESLIMSPMLKVAEHRGMDIVTGIFDALSAKDGHLLMPDDFRLMYDGLRSRDEKRRVICDFIAGMTDRYAIQFYSRLFGTDPETIYSPL